MTHPLTPMDQGIAEALRPEPAPAALRDRLLKEARLVDRSRRKPWWFAAAAALLLMLAGGAYEWWPSGDLAGAMARKAFISHTTQASFEFKGPPTQSSSPCGMWCADRLGYAATLPKAFPPSKVVAGRTCSVGSHPAAYYRLDCGSGLFVFKEMPRELEHTKGFKLPKGHIAKAWCEGNRSYLLVTKP